MKSGPYLFITKNFPPAICGVGDYIYFLAKELAQLGRNVHILTTESENLETGNFTLHPLIKKFSFPGIFKIIREIRKINPSVINFQYLSQLSGKYGFSISTGLLVILIRLFCRARLIMTLHELYIPFGKRFILWPLGVIQRINFILVYLFSDTVIVTTIQRRNFLGRYFPSRNLKYIPVGGNIPVIPITSAEKAAVREQFASSKEILFASFGTASREKDYIFMVKLISELNERNFPSKLLMIGDIERDRKVLKGIQEEICRHNLQDNVILTGTLSKAQISRFLNSCDFFLINQVRGITTGSGTLAAAYAHQIPIIANKMRGLDRIFKDKENIILLPMSDPGDTAFMLADLIKSECLARNISIKAEETFDGYFAWSRIAGQINSI